MMDLTEDVNSMHQSEIQDIERSEDLEYLIQFLKHVKEDLESAEKIDINSKYFKMRAEKLYKITPEALKKREIAQLSELKLTIENRINTLTQNGCKNK